jgi:hypothetical protein
MIEPYATALPFFSKAPEWAVALEDQQRLQAYEVWEKMYLNTPGTYKLLQRGQDSSPIYLPSPKKVLEAVNRFLAVDWNYIIDPEIGETDAQQLVAKLLGKIFKRERMYSKFVTQKRWGLVRGDSVWHIFADDSKAPGSRISIKEVDPANYFPITDPNDKTRVIGVHLVDLIADPKDPKKLVARRQTYRKDPASGLITSELSLFKIDKWDDRGVEPKLEKLGDVRPPITLPASITAIPVYHISANAIPNSIWGLSLLAGTERIWAGVNQAISDEELTLVMQGLGMYVSTTGPPRDDQNNEGAWELGPGIVVELPDENHRFERVTGVSTVAPMQEHIRMLLDETTSALGVPDVAIGVVDVNTAESGIALKLKLSPMLAGNAEREQEMLETYDQMLYDLWHGWLVAYEALPADTVVEVVSVVGDPMPVNRDLEIKEILDLATSTPPMISVGEARARLAKLGWELETDAAGNPTSELLIAEMKALNEASDPFTNRFVSELDNLDSQTGANPGQTTNPVSTAVVTAPSNGAPVL